MTTTTSAIAQRGGPTQTQVFNYRALRLLIGVLAVILPIAVSSFANSPIPLASISASYYTESRDLFVGILCVVAAFLCAYNGHFKREARASKVAAFSAVLVALFPTACVECELTTTSYIHYLAAVSMFGLLAYFCLGPFRQKTKHRGGKKERRSRIYLICGWVIIGSMAGMLATYFLLSAETRDALRITYWGGLPRVF